MALRNSLYLRFAISLSLVFLSACRTTPASKPRTSPPGAAGEPGVISVPTQPSGPEVTSPPPLPMQVSGKKVAIILGPGGAKAFAHIGVLKALQQQRVPVQKIVGLEWGSLIGAMYANKGQLHEVEWKLYKMEQAHLPAPKGFFAKKIGEDTIKVMDGFLQESFPKENIADAKIAFACPSRSVWTGVVAWQTKGPVKDAVRRCLGFPPIFKIQGTFLAGASQASEAMAMLRSEGYNVIILVNVLGNAQPVAQDNMPDNLTYAILWQEVKKSIVDAGKLGVEVINVDTNAYPMVDFDSKKELISKGESAGMKAGAEIVSKYGF